MPDMTGAGRANDSPNEVIDLTLSDNESASQQRTVLQSRPLSETAAGEPSDAALPEHGLLLDRDFGSFNRWGSGRAASFLSRRFLKGATSQRRRHITSKPSRISQEGGVLPSVRPTQDYHANSTKRRRVELDATYHHRGRRSSKQSGENSRSPQIDVVQKTLTTSPIQASAPSNSAQAILAPQQSKNENAKSRDAISESLKVALRQQVFPHVNQRLGHYRLSIDNATRRQLGRKAASEICGADFENNLMQNGGRLSAIFETKVAAMAHSLIDQYADELINHSNQGQGDAEVFKHEFLLKEGHRTDSLKQRKPSTSFLENNTEGARASKKAKLSAAMKSRWARGEMDAITARRMTKNILQNVGQNASQRTPGNLRYRKRRTDRRPAVPPGPLNPVISLDDDNADVNARQLILKCRIGELSRQQATSNNRNNLYASNRRQPTSELGESCYIARRSTRQSAVKEITAAALLMHPLPNARNGRGKHPGSKVGAQNRQKPVAIADSRETHQQIENLRHAALDDRFSRPYLSWEHRKDIERGLTLINTKQEPRADLPAAELFTLHGSILHVDFCQEEIERMIPVIESVIGGTTFPATVISTELIKNLMVGREIIIPKVVTALRAVSQVSMTRLFRSRPDTAVAAFLQDAAAGLLSTRPEIKRVELNTVSSTDPVVPPDTVKFILQQRETWGRRRNPKACRSFKARLLNCIEDDLIRKAEWTDCAGDIATISWIDSDKFFGGATTHSDEHNMQYNKPGNLLVGTAVGETLKSVPGHQIVRPIVTNGDNSLESMRGTQDPWMYCSVTSTAYSHDNRKCFTGSYDQTVKVWDIAKDGSSMSLCGTWSHSGNVNFVMASPSHSLVATAADVREDAVRVYHFDPSNISDSAFSIYEASVQRRNSNDTWAYFPATMQWGISPSVSHLLLVGYSPRSFNCQDAEIPDDRLNTGELCLWDSRNGGRIPIASARTQNVFEVAWHPTQPIFVAATSSAGLFEDWVKTQLRVFEQRPCGSFSHVKTLDCPALDINEITIMPNSTVNAYVTASCTNGNTYVWDSALSDKPLHILRHGDSIDERTYGATREEADIGVKFAAWGNNLDRFYTGSSDGVLKAWNIRAPPGHEFVRDVINLSGGISAGKFSPDFSKLIIGDSTGKVHLLALGQIESSEGVSMAFRRPIAPHPPLSAPLIDDDDMEIPVEQTARETAQEFLGRRQIIIHGDEWVGAVKGPNYASTGLFYDVGKYKTEFGEDSLGWSTPELQEKQQQRYDIKRIRLPQLCDIQSSSRVLHEKNLTLDLDLATLSLETHVQLREARVDLNFQDENDFLFELGLNLDVQDIEEGLSTQAESLNDSEIQELCILEEQICQELKIQKSLKDIF